MNKTLHNQSHELLKNSMKLLIEDAMTFLSSNESNGMKKAYQYPNPNFSKEVASIHIRSRRRMGHTSAMLDYITNSDYNCWVIVPTTFLIVHMERMDFPPETLNKIVPISAIRNLASTNMQLSNRLQALLDPYNTSDQLDICFIDTASTISKSDLNWLYQALYNKFKLFALIQ